MSQFSTRAARRAAALCTLLLLFASHAHAQEAPNTPAATQPAAGHATLREQFRYIRFQHDPTGEGRSADEYVWWNSLAVGLTGDLSLTFDAPFVYRDTQFETTGEHDTHFGLADMTAQLKWRFFQRDFGPIDTLRLALVGGAELPSGDDEFSSDSIDPEIGLIATYIKGRHGFGAAATWKFTTGAQPAPFAPGESLADLLRASASYLYRLAPAEYASDTKASLYGAIELVTFTETNGDTEGFLAPGLLYEARTWAAEVSVGVPIWQDLDQRPEADFTIMLGVRLLF